KKLASRPTVVQPQHAITIPAERRGRDGEKRPIWAEHRGAQRGEPIEGESLPSGPHVEDPDHTFGADSCDPRAVWAERPRAKDIRGRRCKDKGLLTRPPVVQPYPGITTQKRGHDGDACAVRTEHRGAERGRPLEDKSLLPRPHIVNPDPPVTAGKMRPDREARATSGLNTGMPRRSDPFRARTCRPVRTSYTCTTLLGYP